MNLDSSRDSPQNISGKRLVAKNRKFKNKLLKEKDNEIQKLQRQLKLYKVKLHREKLSSSGKGKVQQDVPGSPKKRVKAMLEKNNEEVAQSLLFAEVLKEQLKINYKELKINGEKQNFRAKLSGKITKKYQITNEIRTIVAENKLNRCSKDI